MVQTRSSNRVPGRTHDGADALARHSPSGRRLPQMQEVSSLLGDSHYEVSPREKEDEARRWRNEFDPDQMREEDEAGELHLRRGIPGNQDGT